MHRHTTLCILLATLTLHAEEALPAWEAELKAQRDPEAVQELQGWINAIKSEPPK